MSMLPRRGAGGVARPERGDVDLEALQDAFFRDNLQPSAKVTRSKVSFTHLCYSSFETAGGGVEGYVWLIPVVLLMRMGEDGCCA